MALSQLLTGKRAVLDAETVRVLSECDKLNKQVGEEIRTLSYLLHPPLLDELGLSSAVKWGAEGFERRTGISVKVEIFPELIRLPTDVEMTLFRVIQESLTNVHRYSGSSTAFVTANVSSSEIEVKIGDVGKGMHRDLLNSTNGNVAPHGVGIQGMKEGVRQLDGKLGTTSQLNKGTIVTVTLPLTQSHATAYPESARDAGLSLFASPTETSAPERGVSRKQILIADDHEMLRQGLRTMLEKELEWEICGEATDGQDAVDKTTALQPDLVILDINMPVLNGLTAVRQILRKRPQTKILIFSVHDSDQTVKEIRAAGAHGYISKSNGSGDLMRMVKELI
jgi:CheY-like chemotaxis protein